jgi:hypothetical protein
MKEIIYLDTGVLHSFIAQHYDGLPTATSNERGEEIHDAVEKTKGYNSRSAIQALFKTGNFEIPVLFKSPAGEFSAILQPGDFASEKTIMSQTETGKEIISKQLHDNALQTFETYLTDNGLLYSVTDPNIEGKFIKSVSSFKIIDFKYLKNIIQTKILAEFMFLKTDEEIKKLKSQIASITDKKQKAIQNAALTQMTNEYNKQKKDMTNQLEFIEKSLNYLNDILPTESFILMDNLIAPLKNDYLREKASELMFKYSSSELKISLIGKVASRIQNVSPPDFNDAELFFQFPSILNTVLHPLGVINKGDYIVSPIAIYFE